MTESIKYKESPLKILLTTPTNSGHSPITSIPQINIIPTTQNAGSSSGDTNEDGQTKLITYFHQYSSGETELDPILMDHCYSRPWNWRPETSYIRPTKTLFMKKYNSKGNPTLTLQKSIEEKDIIDVESVSPPPTPIYDVEKAKNAFQECEKFVASARSESIDDWEENVPRFNWSSAQSRLFTNIVKILNADRMARLTYAGTWNEPILRRAVIDKSVQRVRNLMASIAWDHKLTQWLHGLLIDHLSSSYLAAYLDILQSLKAKLPQHVEKMMFGPNVMTRIGPLSTENLFPLLKKPWDPVAIGLLQDKPKKLPGNPIFIVVPSFNSAIGSQSKNLHKWIKLLSTLAHVITVHANLGPACLRMSMSNCIDHLFNATRTKLQEVRNDCPGRPIVLLGFNTGAAIACQVADAEHAVAVVCLGFPLLTAEGKRGEPDDTLIEATYPVLFVIGQNSHRTSQEEMEDLRERMKIETGLIVVGSADDYLRVRKCKRKTEGITQSIVDRCILDEIADFVGSILLSPYPPVIKQMYNPNDQFSNNKHMKGRIRNNSNCSSLESEPPSPQPKNRPVGRPPGSSKKKLNLQGPTTYLTKPEAFRASKTSEALNRAVQSIIPPSPSKTTDSSVPSTAPQSLNLMNNRSILSTGSQLSTLLQTGIRPNTTTINTKQLNSGNLCTTSGVKILENITVSTSLSQKILANGRPVTLVNTVGGGRSTNIGNVVLLPDGTKFIRGPSNLATTVRTIGGSPALLQTLNNSNNQVLHSQNPSDLTKLITTRRPQIVTKSKPTQDNTLVTSTNLTTADIMDLPIIFADDNLVTESNDEINNQQKVATPKLNKSVSSNKQIANSPRSTPYTIIQAHPSSTQHSLKRPASNNAGSSQQIKYAKIIVNKRNTEGMKCPVAVNNVQKSKKYDPELFDFDLETKLKATTVPKPMTVLNTNTNKKQESRENLNENKKSNSQHLSNALRGSITANLNKSLNASGPSRFVYTESSSNKNKNADDQDSN